MKTRLNPFRAKGIQPLTRLICFGLGAFLCLTAQCWSQIPSPPPDAPSFRVLVFSKTLGFRHSSITAGITTLRELGEQNGFSMEATEDSQVFAQTNLARYAAVVFLSATGDVLDQAQESALQTYVEAGGGLVAIHGGVFGPQACEDKWEWYGGVFCCAFTNHTAVTSAVVQIEDFANASTMGFPARWLRTDEWYNFTGSPRQCARVLASAISTNYPAGSGSDHPMTWCRRVGQGRMWYTAMGHTEESFSEPLFKKHLLGGILIAAGRVQTDFTPSIPVSSELAWKREQGSLALLQGGNVVWQFNFAATNTKAFFHPVAVAKGPVLTWDAPTDHKWHHALWFSWKYLNQVNYWETEAGGEGGKGLTRWSEPKIELAPDFSARIVMDLKYQPGEAAPVMTEHRIVTISPPDAEDTYHQDWSLTFMAADQDVVIDRTPLPGEPGGQSWGGYAGLSVRFAKGVQDARVMLPHGAIGFAEGKYRGKASGMDYSAVFAGLEAGIAILDAPDNINHPSPWYAIGDSSMNYFSPAVVQDHPYTLKAGQSLTLKYRVVIHPGRWSSAQLRIATTHYSDDQKSTPGSSK